VAAEVRRRGGRLLELVGPRDRVRLDAEALRRLVPDVARREAYLCGPDALAHRLAGELARAGLPERHVHFESFTF
jgi:ferredoxin-NADP reductase